MQTLKTVAPIRYAVKRETYSVYAAPLKIGGQSPIATESVLMLLSYQVVLNNLSALHHEFNSLHLGDVLQWVSRNGHDIGVFALL